MKLRRGVTFSNIAGTDESVINSERLEDLVTEATLEEGFGIDDLHSTLQSSLKEGVGYNWADLDPALQALLPRILDEEHLSDELLATLAIQFDDPGYSRNITQDNIKMPGNPPLQNAVGPGVRYASNQFHRNREWVEVNRVLLNDQPFYVDPVAPSARLHRWYTDNRKFQQFDVMLKLDISAAAIPVNARRLRFKVERGATYNWKGKGYYSRVGLNGDYGTNREPLEIVPHYGNYEVPLYAEHTTIVINKPQDDFIHMHYYEPYSWKGTVAGSIKLTLTHYQA